MQEVIHFVSRRLPKSRILKQVGYVYALVNSETGEPFYVGSTINIQTRLISHCSFIAANKDYPVYNFIRDNEIVFSLEVLQKKYVYNSDKLRQIERDWIIRLKEKHTLYNVFVPNDKCIRIPRTIHNQFLQEIKQDK